MRLTAPFPFFLFPLFFSLFLLFIFFWGRGGQTNSSRWCVLGVMFPRDGADIRIHRLAVQLQARASGLVFDVLEMCKMAGGNKNTFGGDLHRQQCDLCTQQCRTVADLIAGPATCADPKRHVVALA